ncbi:uncharacterized protein LOC134817806 [Bolinopsis microptera]|uniref:uncharacterized protein LOC134817806 n=1 Tax=Bolinopsis microptera TaxID=2820187 RepID=UPI00307996E5
MLKRKHREVPKVCHQIIRCMGEGRKSRGGNKPYSTKKNNTKEYKFSFDRNFNHKTGVSWDKMIGKNEVKLLSNLAHHPYQTTPTVITDRVHNISDVVPGVSIGPKFWDHDTGDTLAGGNEEAAKINNFLHLTPPMIQLHTAELKKLCNPPPDKPTHCLRQYTTNYVYAAPSIKHPLSREVSVRVDIKNLDLDPDTELYFRDLVSANQNMKLSDLHPKTYEHWRLPKIFRDIPVLLELDGDSLTIHAKQCPTRQQNLSLCYYRLSGFIQEAVDLKPVYKELVLEKLITDFVFDQDEAKIVRFQEKNFVELKLADDGGVLGMTGSKEAVSQAEHIITEISEDVVTERVEIPEPFTSYITDHCKAFKDLLAAHEAIYSDSHIVTFSDTLQNVTEELSTLLSTLTHFTLPCPSHIVQFVMTPRFLEGAANYDARVTPGDDGCLEVIVSEEYRNVFTSLLIARVQAVEETVVTQDIPCSQDVNWDRLSKQFDAHVTIKENSISVTASPDKVKEVGFFLKQREKHIRSQ